MPPRYTYWTILIDGTPTAFRAREREELVPTLKQLQRANPNAEMRWFAYGRLWDSPTEAHAARQAPGPKRTSDWRPGGEHRDPRARFKKKRSPWKRWKQARHDREAGRAPEAAVRGPRFGPRGKAGGERAETSLRPKGPGSGRRPSRPAWKHKPKRPLGHRPPGATGDQQVGPKQNIDSRPRGGKASHGPARKPFRRAAPRPSGAAGPGRRGRKR